MILRELYEIIDGDYDKAIQIMRIEKLMDKHIRKMVANSTVEKMIEAGRTMDGAELFDAAHAVKGVCGNLGLVKLAAEASEICDEFRPGSSRKFTDSELKEKLAQFEAQYRKTEEGIRRYMEG